MASNEYGIGSLRVTPSKAPAAKNKNLPRNHAENLAVAWALTAHQCDTMAERVASILFVLAPIEGSITVRWFDTHPANGLRKAVSELRAR
jgi:hypothetical protein